MHGDSVASVTLCRQRGLALDVVHPEKRVREKSYINSGTLQVLLEVLPVKVEPKTKFV